ncbi:hypothetical protein cyc_01089 [Cyclospora cayetanensis]|uniref:Glycosyltransferase family 32 protein n=1 Tax=Cyclospora cayetanensis TaxID=88456 RepID=A0A1D3D3B5_9EIME|nr:hypothetical protein cyc_01089 [Cyclospora cayetanensis]
MRAYSLTTLFPPPFLPSCPLLFSAPETAAVMAPHDGLFPVDLPIVGQTDLNQYTRSSSVSALNHDLNTDAPAAAVSDLLLEAAASFDCFFRSSSPLKLRRSLSPYELEEHRALVDEEGGEKGCSRERCLETRFKNVALCLCARQGLLVLLQWKYLLTFIPVALLLAWGLLLVYLKSALQAILAAEKEAASRVASFEQIAALKDLSSDALRGLAALPMAPRTVSCWNLQQYTLPLRFQEQQQQRAAAFDLLKSAAAATVPSPADLYEAAPWRQDVEKDARTRLPQKKKEERGGKAVSFDDDTGGLCGEDQSSDTSSPSLYNGCNTLDAHLALHNMHAGARGKEIRLTGIPAVDEALYTHARRLRRRVVHFVSGPEPLTQRELWTLDSTFAAMPGALVRWHVVSATCGGGGKHSPAAAASRRAMSPPEDALHEETLSCLAEAREIHFAQMQLFWRTGFDLQYVQHVDLKSYFADLPLERHASTLMRQPLGPAAHMQHVLQHLLRTLVADVLRVALVYVEGGVYLDTDVISLQELRHLSNHVSCEMDEGHASYSCETCQAVFAFHAGHPRLREWIANVALLLDGVGGGSFFGEVPALSAARSRRQEDVRAQSLEVRKQQQEVLQQTKREEERAELFAAWACRFDRRMLSALQGLWHWLHALFFPPAIYFGDEHLAQPANNARSPDGLTLYGPLPFFSLNHRVEGRHRPGVANDLFWIEAQRRQGVSYWRAVVSAGNIYAVHLYSTQIHNVRGDFAHALEKASSAAIGHIQRSYCTLLCGHLRLQVFAAPDVNRTISNDVVERIKVRLRELYSM